MTDLSKVSVGDELFVVWGHSWSVEGKTITQTAKVMKIDKRYVYLKIVSFTAPPQKFKFDGRSFHQKKYQYEHETGFGLYAYLSREDWEKEQADNEAAREYLKLTLGCDPCKVVELPISVVTEINAIVAKIPRPLAPPPKPSSGVCFWGWPKDTDADCGRPAT